MVRRSLATVSTLPLQMWMVVAVAAGGTGSHSLLLAPAMLILLAPVQGL